MSATLVWNPFTNNFDYTGLTSIGPTTPTTFTAGSIIFSNGSVLSQDNANLFWDDANNRLGLLTNSPNFTFDARGTGHFQAGVELGLPNVNSPSPNSPGGFYFNGDHIDYRAYSYKNVGGTIYYSESYIEFYIDIYADDAYVSWYLDIGSGADGVRVFRDYNYTGIFDDYIDANSFTDDGTIWTPGGAITPTIYSYKFLASYDDGSTKWSAYGDNVSYFSKLLVGNTTTGSYRAKITETDAQSALVVQGTNDGGYATYSQLEIRTIAGSPAFFLGDSNSGSTSAGVMNFFGLGNSAGDYRGELTFINNNLGGDKRVSTWRVVQGAGGTTTSDFYILTRNSGFGYNIYGNYLLNNGFGGITAPTAAVHMRAGSATANTAPMCFTSGALLSTPVAGTVEFLTDKWYATITTGAARKELTLNDTALTSGRVPFATTNGRLTDDADFTFATDTLTVTKIAATTFTGNVTISTKNIVTDTTTGTIIGTGTTQKLGFFNATPVVQQAAATDLGTALSNLGLRASGTAYPITTSGAVSFTGGLTVSTVNFTLTDKDVVLGTTTGTKFGTGTTQKLSFYNSTPIVQPANTVAIDTALVNLGLRASGGVALFDTDIKAGVVGKGLYVKEGTNATMGTATLVAGTVVVNTTKVTATSRIFLTNNVNGGTLGSLSVSARTAGTSFTITSTNILDTSTIAWIIMEPA